MQFILEENPREAKIVVAQPRRLAATGVASRVAAERGEEKPGVASVGYVVRGDSAVCAKSRLVFCTTGVLLRQLQNDKPLDCITHIVVDEVHERHLDSDVLLGLLRQMLPDNPHLRVILMSATLDADRFASYWKGDTPRMHIPGRTFPVTDFMLEHVLSITGYIPRRRKCVQQDPAVDDDFDESDGEAKETPDAGMIQSSELLKRVDETDIDYDLLATLVQYLVEHSDQASDGSILVFLPGAPEIAKATDKIRRMASHLPLLLLPLHGGLQPREQNRVFDKADAGFVKVILSTNIAETSITIPDCTIVIDTAREKQSSYDPENRMPLLIECFASRASLKQRRGRAGRVQEGTCYKLISTKTLKHISEHGEPEIKRCALEQSLLSLMYIGVENGSGSFFNTLIDPPNKDSLGAAVMCLQRMGAVRNGAVGSQLSLTPLGVHLAGIPAHPSIGKSTFARC